MSLLKVDDLGLSIYKIKDVDNLKILDVSISIIKITVFFSISSVNFLISFKCLKKY